MTTLAEILAKELSISLAQIKNTLQLIEEGCTMPFISRYRKEATGGLDEVQIAAIFTRKEELETLQKRKDTILKTINEQGKLTAELKKLIEATFDPNVLEDIYLPYKPKRKTRASVAREKGLEPLAQQIFAQKHGSLQSMIAPFIKGNVKDAQGNAQGYKLELFHSDTEIPVSRSYIPELKKRLDFVETM